MATINEFKIGHVYNFSTIAPNVLEASFKNMKVSAIIGAEEARNRQDIYTIHEQIKSNVLNVNLPISADDCTFIVFTTPDRLSKIIAVEYLVSVQEVMIKKLLIEINNYTSSDFNTIKVALEDLGFRNLKFTLSSVNV